MTSLAKTIAKQLLQIKAIKLSPQSPFTWASGLKSPIYCDNRLALSYPSARNEVIAGFVEKSTLFEGINCIAGVATAGIPHGALLADRLGLPFIYVRSKSKAHGRQNQIEGALKGGESVLVIEDLISTGGSCLAAVEALKEAGCEIAGVLAIFTYEFDKAKRAFEQAKIPFDTLSDYSTLLKAALDTNYINQTDYRTLQHWRKDPAAWSAAFLAA